VIELRHVHAGAATPFDEFGESARGSGAPRMAGRRGYVAAGYSPDVKEALGAIGHVLRQRGWPVADVKNIFLEAGFEVGDGTLRRWTTASGTGTPIISNAKKSGARKKLDDEGRRVAAGWVLSQEKKVDCAATASSSRTNSVSA
jgi:hypothetical protein